MKVTIDLPDDLLAKLDEWIASHVEFKPTREQALIEVTRQRLAPLAIETRLGQFQMANQWRVGQADFPTGSRACLALTVASGPDVMVLLDDKQALEMAEQLLDQVRDRGPGPSGVPQ